MSREYTEEMGRKAVRRWAHRTPDERVRFLSMLLCEVANDHAQAWENGPTVAQYAAHLLGYFRAGAADLREMPEAQAANAVAGRVRMGVDLARYHDRCCRAARTTEEVRG